MELLLLAILVSFVLTLVLGRFVLAELRRLKAGQEIRKEEPFTIRSPRLVTTETPFSSKPITSDTPDTESAARSRRITFCPSVI